MGGETSARGGIAPPPPPPPHKWNPASRHIKLSRFFYKLRSIRSVRGVQSSYRYNMNCIRNETVPWATLRINILANGSTGLHNPWPCGLFHVCMCISWCWASDPLWGWWLIGGWDYTICVGSSVCITHLGEAKSMRPASLRHVIKVTIIHYTFGAWEGACTLHPSFGPGPRATMQWPSASTPPKL